MKKKILVVDFDQNFKRTVSMIFPEDGFELFFAESADTAKAMLNAQQIDLMITEAMLPKQSGFELALEARTQFQNLITIIVSGVYKGLLFRHQAMSEFKAADFFEKPVNVSTFRDRVYELLDLVEQDTVVEKVIPKKEKSKQQKIVSDETDNFLLRLIESGEKIKKPKHSGSNLKKSPADNQKQLPVEHNSINESSEQKLDKSSEAKPARPKASIEKISIDLETIKPESKIEKKKYKRIDEEIDRKFQEIISDLNKNKHSEAAKRHSKKE